MKRKEIREFLDTVNKKATLFTQEKYDKAFIGVSYKPGSNYVAVYDFEKCLDICLESNPEKGIGWAIGNFEMTVFMVNEVNHNSPIVVSTIEYTKKRGKKKKKILNRFDIMEI